MDIYEARDNEIDETMSTDDDESPAEVGFNCLEILPEEMWRELLKYVDKQTLYKCRGVCPELKFVAEEGLANQAAWSFIVRRYLYQENFYQFAYFLGDLREPDHILFITTNKGIRFTKVEDVEKFIAAKDIVTVGSHFPNGCVVFYPEWNLKELLTFYKSLESLVKTFPEDITTLIYEPHYILDPANFLMQLSLIFKLRNLKHLSIYYCHELRYPQKYELGTLNKLLHDGLIKILHMNRLRKLHLREFPPNNDNLPLMTVFKNFVPEWKDLEYLSFNWNNSIDMGDITKQMMEHPPPPKLNHLELQDSSLQLLEYFCRDSFEDKDGIHCIKHSPRLNVLYIQFNNGANTFTTQVQDYSKEESNVIQLFNTLDVNQTDLKVLTVDLYLPPDFQPFPGSLPLDFSVKFAKLTELRFNYVTLLRWESLLEMLNEKLPNVEMIIIQSSYDCLRVFTESQVKIVGVYLTVCKLWKVFPSLKKIHVLYYEWGLKRGGDIPENVERAVKLV